MFRGVALAVIATTETTPDMGGVGLPNDEESIRDHVTERPLRNFANAS